MDGNGYLNRDEFNEFQLRSSGEGCDNEAWEVVKGIYYTTFLIRTSKFDRASVVLTFS